MGGGAVNSAERYRCEQGARLMRVCWILEVRRRKRVWRNGGGFGGEGCVCDTARKVSHRAGLREVRDVPKGCRSPTKSVRYVCS